MQKGGERLYARSARFARLMHRRGQLWQRFPVLYSTSDLANFFVIDDLMCGGFQIGPVGVASIPGVTESIGTKRAGRLNGVAVGKTLLNTS